MFNRDPQRLASTLPKLHWAAIEIEGTDIGRVGGKAVDDYRVHRDYSLNRSACCVDVQKRHVGNVDWSSSTSQAPELQLQVEVRSHWKLVPDTVLPSIL